MNCDTIYCVFGFLDAKDLLSCNLVNREFNKVSKSELLWYKIHEYECPNLVKANYYKSYMGYISLSKTLKLQESLGKFLKQESLYLIGKLNRIPESLNMLQNLRILDMSHNQLLSIPESIGELINLTSLYLEYNHFTKFPEPISKLTNLKRLRLHNNILPLLSESIGKLANLRHLALHKNTLFSLPKSINELKELRTLSLGGNPLTSIPINRTLMTNLYLLQLNHSQTDKVPEDVLPIVTIIQ
jgi:Leucine-rich repeat (LRR) protein